MLIADVGDRTTSQGDGVDDNNDERRTVGGGETVAAEMERRLVVVFASRAGIFPTTDGNHRIRGTT